MKRGQLVRYEQFNRAVKDVQGELEGVGLWYEDSPLTETDVFWCRFPQIQFPSALGFFIEQIDGFRASICNLWGMKPASSIYRHGCFYRGPGRTGGRFVM